MRPDIVDQFLKQLDDAIQFCRGLEQPQSGYHNVKLDDCTRAVAQTCAAIRRVGGPHSTHVKHADDAIKGGIKSTQNIPALCGIAEALRVDLQKDRLKTVEQLIHGELFGDFLESASHLLEEGYKDPAAVLAGGVLEEHLRQLCARNSIDIEIETAKGIKPKKADAMNAELVKAEVYKGLDQKNVTAWLDLRNKAAHGKYREYASDQVTNMISGIREFITRVPA